MLLRAVDAGANFKKHERENREADGMADKSVNVTARRGSEVASLAPSTATTTMTKGEELVGRDERDRERWAKLKRLKQAFHVKRKGKGKESGKGKGNEVGKSGNVEAG